VIDPDLIGIFVRPLEECGLSYMVTGGVASVIYGEPRFTRDIELVLELPEPGIPDLIGAFSSTEFYLPPVEALRKEARRDRHGHFNIIHRDTALRADVYLRGDDPLHAWAFARRPRIPLETDFALWVAPVEYVILRKLQYFAESRSDRHLRDVQLMLEVSAEEIDRVELERWIEGLGLREVWAAVDKPA
jgi:hypothetical protein